MYKVFGDIDQYIKKLLRYINVMIPLDEEIEFIFHALVYISHRFKAITTGTSWVLYTESKYRETVKADLEYEED
jgi:hypothetical protein